VGDNLSGNVAIVSPVLPRRRVNPTRGAVVVFDDYDGLSRITFNEKTLERTQFVRSTEQEPFRMRCVETLDPEYLRREVRFWERYTKRKETQ
jgi:hypothetical protein